jgi:hypothetical protein
MGRQWDTLYVMSLLTVAVCWTLDGTRWQLQLPLRAAIVRYVL